MTHRILSILLLGFAVTACRAPQDSGQVNASPTSSAAARTPVTGTKGFDPKSVVVLYQPDAILDERVPSVEVFAAYIREIQAVCVTCFADASVPEALDVVVAIKPGGHSRVWFVSPSRPENDESLGRLRQQIESVKPPAVRTGPVAFAIMGSIAGARRDPMGTIGTGEFHPPMPKAWMDAASKTPQQTLIPDDVLHHAWPDP